jgi:hypothetical protein
MQTMMMENAEERKSVNVLELIIQLIAVVTAILSGVIHILMNLIHAERRLQLKSRLERSSKLGLLSQCYFDLHAEPFSATGGSIKSSTS